MNNQSSSDVWIPPCNRCGRTHDQTPLKIDYKNKFHQCVDAIACLREIKRLGFHTYIHGTSSLNQRRFAVELADKRDIDIHKLIKDELGLEDMLQISGKALSCLIDGMIGRQIKAQRAA